MAAVQRLSAAAFFSAVNGLLVRSAAIFSRASKEIWRYYSET